MRTLHKNKTKGTWVDFDKDLKLKVRPLDALALNKPPAATETSQEQIWEWFDFICVDWSGYEDDSNAPLECNKENKRLVFSFDMDVVAFCIDQSTSLREAMISTKEKENLKK